MKTEKDALEEDIILGKRFTTYVELAVKRRKKEYYQLQYKTMEISSAIVLLFSTKKGRKPSSVLWICR